MINTIGMDRQDDFAMTTTETDRLTELETVIAKNFQGFYAVGRALAEIKANKLYRMKHLTFEHYCLERFEVARRSAYQYIEAAGVMDSVRNCAQFELLPMNEAQIRPLTRLKDEADQVRAWDAVVKTAPQGEKGAIVTAKFVDQVVKGILGKQIKAKVEKIKEKTTVEADVSEEFVAALWTIVEVVQAEVDGPIKLKPKPKALMIESLQRIVTLLQEEG